MACGCGERFQQTFLAQNHFSIYFDAGRKTVPVTWHSSELAVCLSCGEITAHVPDPALTELQRDASGQRN